MDPRKIRVYTERIHKEQKYITIREEFVVTSKATPLTGKFYAKHEASVPNEKFAVLTTEFVPRHKGLLRFPVTVNATYGFFITHRSPPSRDLRLHFPRKQADFIAKELYMRRLQRGFPVEKFTGVPFKV